MNANTKKMSIRIFKSFLHLFTLFVCHQRTVCRNWFSPSTWVPGIKLRFGSKQLYLLSHLLAFVVCFVNKTKEKNRDYYLHNDGMG